MNNDIGHFWLLLTEELSYLAYIWECESGFKTEKYKILVFNRFWVYEIRKVTQSLTYLISYQNVSLILSLKIRIKVYKNFHKWGEKYGQ